MVGVVEEEEEKEEEEEAPQGFLLSPSSCLRSSHLETWTSFSSTAAPCPCASSPVLWSSWFSTCSWASDPEVEAGHNFSCPWCIGSLEEYRIWIPLGMTSGKCWCSSTVGTRCRFQDCCFDSGYTRCFSPRVFYRIAHFLHEEGFFYEVGIWQSPVWCLARPRCTGKLDSLGDDFRWCFLRARGIWQSLARCLPRPRHTGKLIFLGDVFKYFSTARVSGSHEL